MIRTRKLTSVQLSNGLIVHLYPEPSKKRVCVGIIVMSGSRDDPPGKEGLHHIAEHFPFRGTRRYPTTERLFAPIERYDGDIFAQPA